ncbi:carboxypeptidase regulatory-like domain-containing protein [Burkholderia gladioli]|uniref:carboxypeptidase regulatory-like domain-containing protein n=1 Tax=Burkholderia gladioli TaxID=28095 RepID=UPI00163DEF58|nr:carboxypeptidase regulatory-like domain-containing protein [Burkholderia gladioli]
MELSAVVQVIDGFSHAPLAGLRPAFTLNGAPCRPFDKADGFYAFSALPRGAYRLVASAPPFFPSQVEFEVPPRPPLADAIVSCVLEPSPLYPFPPGTTLLRGQVLAKRGGQPIAGVRLAARYATARGEPRTASTETSAHGRYDGRYALAVRGRLDAAGTVVTLNFVKAGYPDVARQLTLAPGTMQYLDITMG